VIGEVDASGRALVKLQVRPSPDAPEIEMAAWVDTALTGELVMPRSIIQSLGLVQSAAVMAGLADGTQVVLETFSCVIEWFGEDRKIEVVENDGNLSLLGVGLLRDRKLVIDYRLCNLSID
jgi:clan AA aspartic protease